MTNAYSIKQIILALSLCIGFFLLQKTSTSTDIQEINFYPKNSVHKAIELKTGPITNLVLCPNSDDKVIIHSAVYERKTQDHSIASLSKSFSKAKPRTFPCNPNYEDLITLFSDMTVLGNANHSKADLPKGEYLYISYEFGGMLKSIERRIKRPVSPNGCATSINVRRYSPTNQESYSIPIVFFGGSEGGFSETIYPAELALQGYDVFHVKYKPSSLPREKAIELSDVADSLTGCLKELNYDSNAIFIGWSEGANIAYYLGPLMKPKATILAGVSYHETPAKINVFKKQPTRYTLKGEPMPQLELTTLPLRTKLRHKFLGDLSQAELFNKAYDILPQSKRANIRKNFNSDQPFYIFIGENDQNVGFPDDAIEMCINAGNCKLNILPQANHFIRRVLSVAWASIPSLIDPESSQGIANRKASLAMWKEVKSIIEIHNAKNQSALEKHKLVPPL